MKNRTLSVQIMYNAKGGDSFELNSKLHSDLLLRSGATITALNMILSKSNSDTLAMIVMHNPFKSSPNLPIDLNSKLLNPRSL